MNKIILIAALIVLPILYWYLFDNLDNQEGIAHQSETAGSAVEWIE